MFRADHRAIEAPLDLLLAALTEAPKPDLDRIRRNFDDTCRLTRPHFEKEEKVFYPHLRSQFPSLVAKMERQHADLRELEETLKELLEAPGAPPQRRSTDIERCGRHFQALLQHHMLEEERDLFRLADQVLTSEEQEALAAALKT